MANFLVYVWRGRHSVACVSAEDEEFARQLKRWAEDLGYTVEFRRTEPHARPENH